MKNLKKIIEPLFAILGGFLFAQIPSFILLYTQQLIGRVNELKILTHNMKVNALQTGKNFEQLIQKFMNSGDQDFTLQGKLMLQTAERYEKLSESLSALLSSSPLSQVFSFLRHFDLEIARDVVKNYRFTLPITLEGLLFGLIGVLLGALTIKGITHFLMKLFSSEKKGSSQGQK